MKSKKKIYITVFLTLCAIGVFTLVYINATVTNAVLPFPGSTDDNTTAVSGVSTSSSGAGSGSTSSTPNSQITAQLSSPKAPTGPIPTTLSIPALNINAPVVEVGLTPTGAMATAHSFTKVGWYEYGTVPGDIGSAVIEGHVDNGLALAGIFKHLSNIAKGDDIEVTLSSGRMLHFTVTDISTYDYKNAPSDQIFDQSDGRYLKLITCTGILVESEHTYDKRLVVTATLTS